MSFNNFFLKLFFLHRFFFSQKRKSGRIAVVLLSLLLCACQPTPEVEFVVNKGDGAVEEKLAEAAETPRVQTFPDRWDEGPTQVNDRLTLTVRAEVIQKADGVYPVYRTRSVIWTKEQVAALLNQLLPPPVAETPLVDTKADWTRAYQEWLDDLSEQQAWIGLGKPKDGVDRDETVMSPAEIDRISKEYQRLIAEAPDELESTPVSDFSGLQLNTGTSIYALSDGTRASVRAHADMDFTDISVYKDCGGSGYIYYQYTHDRERELGEAKPFLTVKLPREQAEETLARELDRLGFTDYTVARATPANLCIVSQGGEARPLSAGWGFQLRRSNGGYPLSGVSFMDSRALIYGDEDALVMNRPIPDETIELFIDEGGVRAMQYRNPKEVVALESENVELLPFEQVQMRIKNAFIATAYPDQPIPLTIYRLLLTACTVRVKDSDDFYEMPCWVIFFTWNDVQAAYRDNPQIMQEALILNAVDGSIVHGEYGY